MTQLFKEVDDVVRMGKWLYLEIPIGDRCKGCPLLSKTEPWCCGLRPSIALFHVSGGPLKDDSCPRKEGV